ncbi:MAG TPA: methionyl-tRNA formyltransferase [Acholeplasmataceae bacterium]|nr:methionyl-tRNA formyltransferase [Acholeplasmataceae bacterium]
MKIVFMGTPEFAVPILEKIQSQHEVILAVTQPDTYNQRKRKIIYSPVKEFALKHGLPLFQPESIKTEKEKILNLEVDLIVTAAYGQFVPKVLLEHPRYKAINVHGSLLPKYRGGAPIQRAIMNGEETTGISIIYMTPKMDAGDIIMKREIPILDEDTSDTMFEKLSSLGSEMILEAICSLEKGTVKPERQDEKAVTFAYNLTKEDELLDFQKPARTVFNQIRGLASNPGAYFRLDGFEIKVYRSRIAPYNTSVAPGRIIKISKDSFDISCGEGTVLQITEVQVPSKKRMSTRDFLNGNGRNLIQINKEIDQ